MKSSAADGKGRRYMLFLWRAQLARGFHPRTNESLASEARVVNRPVRDRVANCYLISDNPCGQRTFPVALREKGCGKSARGDISPGELLFNTPRSLFFSC